MAKTIRVRFLKTKKENLLAMCDTELIGKILKEGKVVLDLKNYSSFYGDEDILADSKVLAEYINEATSINAVGKEAISALRNLGVDVSAAKEIRDTPHIQIYRL